MSSNVQIYDVSTLSSWHDNVRGLLRSYVREIGVSLDFQDFERELLELPGKYAPPDGCLLLATDGMTAVGCAAIRPLAENTAELKRMYVQRAYRGQGIGAALLDAAISELIGLGYRCVRLDTLDTMHDARRLYIRAGFREIPAYYHNPIAGAKYYELTVHDYARQIVAEHPGFAGQGTCHLIVHNDDDTTMEFVMRVLLEAVGLPRKLAWAVMSLVHEEGRYVARRFADPVEANRMRDGITAAARAEGFPLKVTVECPPD